jgi:hypothetical protein
VDASVGLPLLARAALWPLQTQRAVMGLSHVGGRSARALLFAWPTFGKRLQGGAVAKYWKGVPSLNASQNTGLVDVHLCRSDLVTSTALTRCLLGQGKRLANG